MQYHSLRMVWIRFLMVWMRMTMLIPQEMQLTVQHSLQQV